MKATEKMMFRPPEGLGKGTPMVDLEDFQKWILFENEDLLVLNKPGWLVCHPSKNGPLSSLVGAAKLHLGLEKLHLVSRLDRETSGLVILAKNRRTGSAYQKALEQRKVEKHYLAILRGVPVEKDLTVEQPLAKDFGCPIHSKQVVRQDRTAQQARTRFQVLLAGSGWSLCRVLPHTGRKHQIRAHAEWLGCPVGGDKLYGGDPTCFLEFIEKGWTENLHERLVFPRQALHAHRMTFHFPGSCWFWVAPPPEDFLGFAKAVLGDRCPDFTDTEI